MSIWGAVTLVQTLVEQFGSQWLVNKVRLGNNVPHLDLWQWVAVGLALLLLLTFEGAVRVARVPHSNEAPQALPAPPDAFTPATPFIFPDEDERQRRRTELGLRPPGPLQEGLPIAKAPRGTFFFVSLYEVPFSNNEGAMTFIKPLAFEGAVEMHKVNSGTLFVLVYVSRETEALIGDNTQERHANLFPQRWAENVNLISFRYTQDSDVSVRPFRDGQVYEVWLHTFTV